MTFFGSQLGGMESRGATLSNSPNRTAALGKQYAPFANPFFDQASTYLPQSVKSLFGFCRNYYLTHGIINAIITKASEYPITDIILSHKDKGVVDRWDEMLLGSMDYRTHQFETNLDYYTYGNAFVSVSFPFRKKLKCNSCGAEHDALEKKAMWRYTDHRFYLVCDKCGQADYCTAKDEYIPKPSEINLIRWNPENVSVFYNESTGRLDYALEPSPRFKSQVTMGKKDIVATSPQIFLSAVKEKRALVFDRREVFHMRRPSLSSAEQGWGTPLMMPVLKDAFYMQVMKRAQEAVLLQHMIPQVFIYPQPATSGADPFTSVNLQDWRSHIQRELARQRMDPSYYGILPFPMGHQVIGENGRALLLMQEIRMMGEMCAIGMGFPIDLVFGQGTYAGSSVSMRMIENFFLSNVQTQYRLMNWVTRRVGTYLNWPTPTSRFKPFKMADDLQRIQLAASLNGASKLSDTSLLSLMDYDVEEESQLQVKEIGIRGDAVKKQQLQQAEIQGEMAVIQAKYQVQAQEVMLEAQRAAQVPQDFAASQGSQLAQAPAGIPLNQVAEGLASQISSMSQGEQDQHLGQLGTQQPELAELVRQRMLKGPSVDMRPMPEQRPPRRTSLGGAG